MSQDESDTTAAELASVRSQAEDAFLDDVRELESRAKALVNATRSLAETGGTGDETAPEFEAPQLPSGVELPPSNPRQPDQAPWPTAAGRRGLLNRLAGWVLRDYLAVLDSRHEALAERSLHLERDLAAANAALAAAVSAQLLHSAQVTDQLTQFLRQRETQRGMDRRRQEELREGLTRAAEAVDMMSGVALKLRVLLNAKDAEVAHSALGAPDRKIEVVLDRLGRRQEALLAELVGAGGAGD